MKSPETCHVMGKLFNSCTFSNTDDVYKAMKLALNALVSTSLVKSPPVIFLLEILSAVERKFKLNLLPFLNTHKTRQYSESTHIASVCVSSQIC